VIDASRGEARCAEGSDPRDVKRKDGATERARSSRSSASSARRGRGPKPASRPLQDPAAFKAAIYAKGWTLKELAARWGMTLDGLLKLARDENRSVRFDDAVRGLKRVGPSIKLRRAWRASLDGEDAPPRTRPPGLRYHGYLVVGAVVAATKDVGSIAEEGMHGIVLQVIADRTQEIYRVLFETGEVEVFTPDLVDAYLQDVGLQREDLMQYCYNDDATVAMDFARGAFAFW